MPRTIPSDILTAIQSGSPEFFWAVELLFDSPNELYFWTGVGSKTVNSTVYLGAADIMSIDLVPETRDGTATSATITFSGGNATIVGLANNEDYQWRRANVLLGTEGSTTLLTAFSGPMDKMPIEIADDGSVEIKVTVESRFFTLSRPRPTYYTPETLQRTSSGDTFFNFVGTNKQLEVTTGPPS